ncbi:MAG TPA: ankyrin repeat domain-containing protein [Anaerovoracaceae bacterium]|nr:ankyrin repeat domain-containing protein [Anaerovoracaceae bacterium]
MTIITTLKSIFAKKTVQPTEQKKPNPPIHRLFNQLSKRYEFSTIGLEIEEIIKFCILQDIAYEVNLNAQDYRQQSYTDLHGRHHQKMKVYMQVDTFSPIHWVAWSAFNKRWESSRGSWWSLGRHITLLHELIYEWKFDINSQDKVFGHTPLHVACIQQQGSLIKYFLECGANPNIQDSEGNTALHWLVKSCHPEYSQRLQYSSLPTNMACRNLATTEDIEPVMTAMLDSGFDYKIKNSQGQTVLDIVDEVEQYLRQHMTPMAEYNIAVDILFDSIRKGYMAFEMNLLENSIATPVEDKPVKKRKI